MLYIHFIPEKETCTICFPPCKPASETVTVNEQVHVSVERSHCGFEVKEYIVVLKQGRI